MTVARLRRTAQSIRSLATVPHEVQGVHGLMLKAADDLVYACDEFTAGVGTREGRRLLNGAKALRNFTERTRAANDELQRIKAQYDWSEPLPPPTSSPHAPPVFTRQGSK
jgi:hypothetical protein